jgi:hypothetical protein
MVQCGTKVTGWEATPLTSPVGRFNVMGAGIWLSPEELVDAQIAAWPEFPLDCIAIELSIEEQSSVGSLIERHSACRSLCEIAYYSIHHS